MKYFCFSTARIVNLSLLGVMLSLFVLAPANLFSQAQMPPNHPPMGDFGDDTIAQEVLKRMQNERSDDLETMSKIHAGNVVVLRHPTDLDHVDLILKAFDVKFTVVWRKDFESYDLSKVHTVLINCNEAKFSEVAIKKIKNYVEGGGYLFTSDWCMQTVLERAFPRYIQYNGVQIPKKTVSIKPAKIKKAKKYDKNVANLIRDVFPEELTDPKWVLDIGCKAFIIKKKTPTRVTPLIESKEMAEKYKTNLIAVTWLAKKKKVVSGSKGKHKGRVLHVVSHFYQQTLGYKDTKSLSSM